MTYVSFPGLGIEPFHMERVAFSVFGISVNWYGLIITSGMILAVLYALWHAKCEKVKSDDIIDLALYLIIFGVIGARLYYVVMEFGSYLETGGSFWENLLGTLYNMIAVWNGGLAIYGGIIAGFLTGLVVARKKKIRFPVIADIAGPAVMVGQIIGRWGNFVNVEAYGGETALPWRMGVLQSYDGGATFVSEMYVHPTFLYESLWNLLGLILITVLYKKKKFHGQMFLTYITWYGFGRMLIEGLRADSLYIGSMRVSQFVGFASFVVGSVLLILGFRRAGRRTGRAETAYVPIYVRTDRSNGQDVLQESSALEQVGNEPPKPADGQEKAQEKENEDGKAD